ncbi:MAG: aldo/keto reductase [Sphingobium sp.]
MTRPPTRQIGDLTVSNIGLGCMNLNHAYGPGPGEAYSIRLLNHALDAGVTFFDTAAIYGAGDNERLVGKAIMHRRTEFTLASKCVLGFSDGKRFLDGRPETMTQTLDEALVRLGTDHIDLYYMHRLDQNVPIEESMGALVRAKEVGKISAIGLSEMSARTIRRAHSVHAVTAIQTEYSPWVRNPEIAVLDICEELGIGFVAFSPLGRGFLAGSVTDDSYAQGDIRAMMPRFVGSALIHNLSILARFRAVAGDAGITSAQLALAWVLSRRPYIVALPGTRSIAHLDEDLAAAHMVVPVDVLSQVDQIFAPGEVAGARYPLNLQAQIDTELLPEEEASAVSA